LQQKVLPEYDERLIIDYDSQVQEDKEFTLKAYQAKPSTVQVNEWRAMQGLPPLDGPGGLAYMRPMNESVEYGFSPEEPSPEEAAPEPITASLKTMTDRELIDFYDRVEKMKI
jgi:hypothetical protein